jgi:hypothetical protein
MSSTTKPRIDASLLKLGKKPARYDRETKMFSAYRIGAQLPPMPAEFGFETVEPPDGWGMMGNGPDDSVALGFEGCGDCFWAGSAHETMLDNKINGKTVNFTGKGVVSDYSAGTGYVIGNDSSDQGTDPQEGYKYRQTTGIIDANGVRHKIGTFLALEPGNLQELYEAIYIFKRCGVGIQVPSTAMDQYNEGKPWSVVPGASIEGGHYIPLVAKRNMPKLITWGTVQRMTEQFYKKYNDESFIWISAEMLNAVGKTVGGFNIAQLQLDMGIISTL